MAGVALSRTNRVLYKNVCVILVVATLCIHKVVMPIEFFRGCRFVVTKCAVWLVISGIYC